MLNDAPYKFVCLRFKFLQNIHILITLWNHFEYQTKVLCGVYKVIKYTVWSFLNNGRQSVSFLKWISEASLWKRPLNFRQLPPCIFSRNFCFGFCGIFQYINFTRNAIQYLFTFYFPQVSVNCNSLISKAASIVWYCGNIAVNSISLHTDYFPPYLATNKSFREEKILIMYIWEDFYEMGGSGIFCKIFSLSVELTISR